MNKIDLEIIKEQKIKNKGVYYTNKPTRFPDKPSLIFYPTQKIIYILIVQACILQFPDFLPQMNEAIRQKKR